MCVFKNNAFIFFLQPPSWSGTVCTRLTPYSPCSPCSPYSPYPLTWNPPCCVRIRPPLLPVARKLTLFVPHLAHVLPLSKIPTPPGFPDLNMHLIRTTLWTRPKCSLTVIPVPVFLLEFRVEFCSPRYSADFAHGIPRNSKEFLGSKN
jgi:hypothetical protein